MLCFGFDWAAAQCDSGAKDCHDPAGRYGIAGRLEVAANHAAIHAPFRRLLATGDPSAAPGLTEEEPKQRKRGARAPQQLDMALLAPSAVPKGPMTTVPNTGTGMRRDRRDRRSMVA